MEIHKSDRDAFISEEMARELARQAVERESTIGGPPFEGWKEAYLGDSLLVRTVYHDPSYWLIPVKVRGVDKGFVRVLGDGRVAHVGFFPSREDIKRPPMATGLTQEEALLKASERIHSDRGETPSLPVYVHDGPIGREAWLVEVLSGRKPTRWIFVTPGFIYERPAGTELGDNVN